MNMLSLQPNAKKIAEPPRIYEKSVPAPQQYPQISNYKSVDRLAHTQNFEDDFFKGIG